MYFTAEEARKLANDSNFDSTELGNILEKIRKEAKEGEYSINCECSDKSAKKLEELGYSVYWNRSCLWYEISW